jgi:acyl-CoA synthetase (AMP-forming)/AMP-acid ligase II
MPTAPSDALAALFDQPFGTLSDALRLHARERADHPAVIDGDRVTTYAALDALVDRAATALQRDGVEAGGASAICAFSSLEYVVTFLAALRVGAAAAPLAPSSTAESLLVMLEDCAAPVLVLDAPAAQTLAPVAGRIRAKRVSADGSDAGTTFRAWLTPEGSAPTPAAISPDDAFNIIYSSGTTGAPKGIVQPHAMRWQQMRSAFYDADAVTLVATPLYSNTTLVSVIPTLAWGGTLVLMAKFDAERFLQLSEAHRATHAMLVPVQYRRLMDRPDFDGFDLSSYRLKFCTSAPFAASLKADVLKRWPGGLVEFYGMTEGGGSCMLLAHDHPDKLATVGRPMPGHDMRVIDEDGVELPPGAVGEVVGRSASMMVGYHNQPGKTREAEWFSPDGLRYIRTGDVGRFDEDGFLTLMDRKKDMIISGGFNIYPSDIEHELHQHPAVAEAAVIGVPSDAWGETPVAYVALKPGADASPEDVKAWVNGRVGKTQRLADLRLLDPLPRSAIGKVLKRELRDLYAAG